MTLVHTQEVASFEELHRALARYAKDNLWLFRGHASREWELKPKAARNEFKEADDRQFFEAWKRRAAELIRGTEEVIRGTEELKSDQLFTLSSLRLFNSKVRGRLVYQPLSHAAGIVVQMELRDLWWE